MIIIKMSLDNNLTQEEYNKFISVDDDLLKENKYNYCNECKSTEIINDGIDDEINYGNNDGKEVNNHSNDENNINKIDLNDYEIPEDETKYTLYVDMLNIFNIYQKFLYKKADDSTILDDIDNNDPTSTNRPLEKLYDEIYKYKTAKDQRFTKLFDPVFYRETYLIQDSKLPEDYPFYLVEIDETQMVTHNLITALLHISSFEWQQMEWSINQINEF